MLVIRRKKREAITITNKRTGEIITIAVVSCDGNRVGIGIEADDNYEIMRSELLAEPLSAHIPPSKGVERGV